MNCCEVKISASGAAIESTPAPLAHQAVHDTVVNIVQQFPKGKLLDVPAGTGALASRLIAAGFHVTCGDLYPELFQLEDVEIQSCDLGERLPYPDCSFDHATCIEGLEHLENAQHPIREFARVLRPGGQFVTSVPNVLNIEERLKLSLYGYTSHFKPISRASLSSVPAEYADKKEVALHVNPISYPELRYSLEESGFEIVKLYRDKPKRNSWVYWPVVLLIRLIGWLTPRQKKRERWTDELMSDEVLWGGNTLIVQAVKK